MPTTIGWDEESEEDETNGVAAVGRGSMKHVLSMCVTNSTGQRGPGVDWALGHAFHSEGSERKIARTYGAVDSVLAD